MRNKPLPGMMKHSPMKQKEHEYEREESMRTVSGVDKFKQFIKTLPISRTVRKIKRAANIYKKSKKK